MSDLKRYQGVFPAFYACYDERGNVSPERAARLTEHLISKGVQGLYVCGSSGECIYQDVEERKETLRAVVEAAAGRVTIIAHVAANSYAAMPELFLRMDALIRAGRAQDATAIQMDVNRIITALCSCHGNMYAVIKELLRRRGVDIGSVRAPLSPLCAQDMPLVDRCEEMIDKAPRRHFHG